MNISTILKVGPYILIAVLIYLWQNNLSEKKEVAKDLKKETDKNVTLNAKYEATKDFVNKLQTTKTSTEVYYKNKSGKEHRKYTVNLNKKDKLITKLRNKQPKTVIVYDTTTNIQTVSDGFIAEDLTLDYVVETRGILLNIDFEWEVKEKTIIKNNIIYETVYKDKDVFIKKTNWIFNYNYGLSSNFNYHDFNVTYTTKIGIGINFGVSFIDMKNPINYVNDVPVIDKEIIPKVGVSIKF